MKNHSTHKCPICHKPASFSTQNTFRPFCSKRCQTIDLGAWASEDYKVPSEEGHSTSQDEQQ